MISNLKDKDEKIFAYIEWWVCDSNGVPCDGGLYCNIKDLWIHKNYNGKKIIPLLITLIDQDERMKNVKWVYWYRTKYNDRPSKLFKREKAAKKGA